jgi:hypothetical protein
MRFVLPTTTTTLAILVSAGCATDAPPTSSAAAADTNTSVTLPGLDSWWSLPDSALGYYNIDSRVRVDADPGATSGLSWGLQVTFVGGASAGHVELRDGIEAVGKTAYFTFGGATAVQALSGATCSVGDYSTVQCSLPYHWQAGHVYRLRVWVVDQSAGLWVVAVQDETTQIEKQIGTFTVPHSQLLMGQLTTFTYTYELKGHPSCCAAVPRASATFFVPTGNDLGVTATGFLTTIDPGASCDNVSALFHCTDGTATQSINTRLGRSGQDACD